MNDSYLEAVKFTAMGVVALCLAAAVPDIAMVAPESARASQGMFQMAAMGAFGGGILFGAYGWLVRRYW